MGKFVDKRRKFQSRHEIDQRESKALAKAEAKQELLGMEHLQRSTSRMMEYLFGLNGGIVSDPHVGIEFLNTPGYWIDAIVPPGMAAAQRPRAFDYALDDLVEIPAYAMDLMSPYRLRTGFERTFRGRDDIIVVDSYSPGLDETLGWGGPRSLNISSIESMGTYSPKGVEVRVVGDGEFTDEEPVCPHCGRRHRSYGMGSLFGSLLSEYIDMLSNARRGRRDIIEGEATRVQENNLLTHDPKDPE